MPDRRALYVIDQRGREQKVYLTTMAYASVGQEAQVLAGEAASLLPGHPALASQRSLAYIGGLAPATRAVLPVVPGGSVTLGPGRRHLLVFFATWLTETSDLSAELAALSGYAPLPAPAAEHRRVRRPVMAALDAIGHALAVAGSMTWQITWSLILGFTLSAVVAALARRQMITRRLGNDRPPTIALAAGLGAASSSCSYAAVALARSLFRKGASLAAAMVFEIASTNLVIELGIILALLISWQFTLAEFIGGPIMIVLVAVAFRLFVRQRLIEAARRQARQGPGRLHGRPRRHGHEHQRRRQPPAVAGQPRRLHRGQPHLPMLSFVCSIGNVPLAGVLWNGGISFGGVVAFIFADLIIIPILIIYRRYYGTKMTLVLLGTFYATMVIAAYIAEFLFSGLGLVPAGRTAKVAQQGIQWNYTTFLNIIFLLLAAALLVRFFRSGGGPMLNMMGGSPDQPEHAYHASCHAGSAQATRRKAAALRGRGPSSAKAPCRPQTTRMPRAVSPGALVSRMIQLRDTRRWIAPGRQCAGQSPAWCSQASRPSLTANAVMTSAAAGSAHHQPSQVFRPAPSRVAAEVTAQKAVSAESAIRVRLPSACPVRRLATARSGMTSRAAAATAGPAADGPGRAWVTRSRMPSAAR